MSGRPRFAGGIYLVTDAAACGTLGVLGTVREAVTGGVRTVQIREKAGQAADLLDLVCRVASTVGHEALVLVNDRVDVFLAARARGAAVHGVHVGQSDLPVEVVRDLVGDDAVLGLTADTPVHLDALRRLPPGTVDYLGVGAIHPTATKPDHPPPLGADGFAALAARSPLPCVAIGGITARDVSALRRAGAAGVAVVSAICASDDPADAARILAAEWNR